MANFSTMTQYKQCNKKDGDEICTTTNSFVGHDMCGPLDDEYDTEDEENAKVGKGTPDKGVKK